MERRFDALIRDRGETVAVHPDIHRVVRAGERAVRVAIQMPGAVMRIPPDPESIVAQNDKLLSTRRIGILDLQLIVVFDPAEAFLHPVRCLVVVTSDQADIPLEPSPNRLSLIEGAEEEIA